ncbi:hypothetical protein Tco_0658313 [Tanacetum coccineum]
MNQNFYNSSRFDQFQPPQYPVIHYPPQETSEEVLQARENLMKSIQTFLNKFNRYPFGEIPKVLLVAWERFSEIKHAFTDKQYQPEDIHELMRKLLQDFQNISEELAEYINSPSWNHPAFYFNDDDDEYTIIYRSTKAITHNLPTEEPEYSLSMADEHPNTIPKTESDKLMKSSVENLVLILSESKDISDDECELPLCDDSPETQFTTFSNPLFDSNDDFSSSDDESFSEEDVPIEEFKIYSNPLFDFDEEIISSEENSISNKVLDEINSIPPRMNDCFNAESDLIESLLNRDTSIDSFHEIDSLFDEFADKFILLKPISPEIDNSDFDLEGEIHLIKRLLYDNSSPRPPEDLSIESFSPSPIPVEDSDSFMEEIDIFLASDDSTPPGVESDYDSEGDILFLEELLNNNLVPLSKYNHFTFDVEPDTTVKNDFDELNKDECFDPGGEIDVFANVEDNDYFPFTFIIRIFLPYLTYPEVSPLLLSTGSEDTIFDPDIST